jgi:protein TonB
LLEVLTLVLWVGCLAVGVLGLVLPYPQLRRTPSSPAAPPTQLVEVEVKVAPAPRRIAEVKALSALSLAPAPVAAQLAIPAATPLKLVAEPVPPIAFPLPVDSRQQTVDVEATAPAHSPGPGSSAPTIPQVRSLVLGQGEGNQPRPEYPPTAIRSGQEGTVRIGLSVDRAGRVVSAEVVTPSPWPLLNEAALRTVRRVWRFAPGDLRRYEVSIAFQIAK